MSQLGNVKKRKPPRVLSIIYPVPLEVIEFEGVIEVFIYTFSFISEFLLAYLLTQLLLSKV